MSAPSRLTVLVGLPASGKSEVATVLRATGFEVVDVGGVLRDALRAAGIDSPDRARVGPLFLEAFGLGAVAEVLARAIPTGAPVALDAVRFPETVRQLEACFDVSVVLVTCPEAVRRRRLAARVATWGEPEAAVRAYEHVRGDLRWLGRRADTVIQNGACLQQLRAETAATVGTTLSRSVGNIVSPSGDATYISDAIYCGFCGWFRADHDFETRRIRDRHQTESILRALSGRFSGALPGRATGRDSRPTGPHRQCASPPL